MTLHVHISIESADCDGRYSRSYTVPMVDSDEWQFRSEMIGNALTYADDNTTAQFTEHGFNVNAPTDEGYHHSEFTWCTDDPCEIRATYRDHSAEAAGY